MCERPAADIWITAAQEELHRPFDLATGPLARCRYLLGESCGDLIITIHHTIVDGTSAVHLFGELLALCAGRAPGDAGETAHEGRIPALALFPSPFTGLRLVRAEAAFMGRQMADEMKFRWRSRGVRKPPIAATGHCRVLPVRFSATVTTALIQASRRHRITLNAIFGAGMMAAVQRRLYPSSRLQTLNKDFGTTILISETTFQALHDEFECRLMPEAQLRGKTKEVRFYEVVSVKTAA